MIFRTDDVSLNTDFQSLRKMHEILFDMFPVCKVWSCVNIFSKENTKGSVHPNPPFKDNDLKFFLDVDLMMGQVGLGKSTPVSHGLWHFDHSSVSKDLQEASILTSCKFLQTNVFVPPFNRYNEDTIDICHKNFIQLAKPEDGWKSMEHNDFDPKHKKWYFHPWRWTVETFTEYLQGVKTLS